MSRFVTFVTVFALCWLAPLQPSRAGTVVTILAASSLNEVLEAIGAAYRDATGQRVRFSFAASSALARQIIAGAPADIFVSANATWMDELQERGLIEPGTRRVLASNRLVLVTPAGRTVAIAQHKSTPDLEALLGPRGRLAIGDPDHVPAGIYARQVLMAWGMWDALEARLARADNVRAALALVARGETPLGFVYATDARITRSVSIALTIPDTLHEPIVYPFALVKGRASADAEAFADFLAGDTAKSILAEHGFSVE